MACWIISGETLKMAMMPMVMRGHRQDGELHHLGDDDADHAALDRVERSQAQEDDRVDVLVGEKAVGGAR